MEAVLRTSEDVHARTRLSLSLISGGEGVRETA